MTLGALDKVLFNNWFGYGAEFERGLSAMGSLTTVMVGTMCAAPALGSVAAPVLTPLFAASVRTLTWRRKCFFGEIRAVSRWHGN